MKLAKLLIVFALAFVGMSSCFSDDFDCGENQDSKQTISKELSHKDSTDNHNKTPSEKETHHCLCSLTCHTMFMSMTNFYQFKAYALNFSKDYQYTPHFYPEVITSLEKPPTV